MNKWCESCARKNVCYSPDIKPKCYSPTTNTAVIYPYRVEIIEKRAVCDREDTDCTLCFKESHCKALAKAERELK